MQVTRLIWSQTSLYISENKGVAEMPLSLDCSFQDYQLKYISVGKEI